MRFVLNGYIVDVQARRVSESKPNKNDTMDVMNNVSIAFDAASDIAKARGHNVSATVYREVAKEIYEKLESLGCYN